MINRLLLQKMLVAFVVAFVGVFVKAYTGIAPGQAWSFDKAALIALVVAAITAGIRAVIAISPLNLVPSDDQHTVRIGRRKAVRPS